MTATAIQIVRLAEGLPDDFEALRQEASAESYRFVEGLREEWLAGSADLACRKWRLAHPERVSWFETDNRRYRIDIDTPEDYARLITG